MRHSRSHPTAHTARRLLAFVAVLALAACKSDNDRREDVVRCAAFSFGLLDETPAVKAMDAMLAKEGITGQDTFPIGASANQYAKAMDPARVTKLTQEGLSSAKDLIARKDANGLADYMRGCVKNFKELAH